MNKQKTLKILNEKIDKLIIKGLQNTREFNRLCGMHKKALLSK